MQEGDWRCQVRSGCNAPLQGEIDHSGLKVLLRCRSAHCESVKPLQRSKRSLNDRT